MGESIRAPETVAIRGGLHPDPVTGAILPPIAQSTTFVQSEVGATEPEYSYSRASNPTVTALEHQLGALEDSLPAICCSTGMAAVVTLCFALLRCGSRVIAANALYGGTYRLLREFVAAFGVETEFVDASCVDAVERALATPATMLLLESPANPTLRICDLHACAERARAAGTVVVVDNTFLTPCLQRPLDHGAHITLYSTTKYHDGHNATVGGALLTRDPELRERLHLARRAIGTIQTPFHAWLTLQGIKTLPLRMTRHAANAFEIARWLADRPEVRSVRYPWLPSFDQHALARRQQRAGGGVVAVELASGLDGVKAFVRALRLASLAENLGSAETLVTHPGTMTHAAIPAEARAAVGITDGLLRISVGLEAPADLIADLARGLDAAGGR